MRRFAVTGLATGVTTAVVVGSMIGGIWLLRSPGADGNARGHLDHGLAGRAPAEVAEVTGFTRMALSERFVVVVRISPLPDDMIALHFIEPDAAITPSTDRAMHPDTTDSMDALGPDQEMGDSHADASTGHASAASTVGDDPPLRHVTAHVYERSSGLSVPGPAPGIRISVHQTGTTVDLSPAAMQDADLGSIDMHFGANIAIPGDSDVTVSVTIDGEEVSVDGYVA